MMYFVLEKSSPERTVVEGMQCADDLKLMVAYLQAASFYGVLHVHVLCDVCVCWVHGT